MANPKLDRLDTQILKLIADDARIPFLEVARICEVSGAAIHQRIQKLTNLGILKGSQFIIDPEKIGYDTCAFIGLNLKNPEKFDEVVEKLKEMPEVVECHLWVEPFLMEENCQVFLLVSAKSHAILARAGYPSYAFLPTVSNPLLRK